MRQFDRHEHFHSQHVESRTVAVWVPRAYHEQRTECFPVLYVHDGQNVLDPVTAFTGVHWRVPEALEQLMDGGAVRGAIVVAIWHTRRRSVEYLPKLQCTRKPPVDGQLPRFEDNPVSDAYLRFCVEELKPFVDASYRTLSGAGYAYMMGSSRGALISLYGACKYPDVFGGAACLSTHWPASRGASLSYLAQAVPAAGQHRFYFDYGSRTLDSAYGPYQKRMDQAMLDRGYRHGHDWVTRYYPGAEHSEAAWAARVSVPLSFLLGPTSPAEAASAVSDGQRME